MFYMMSMPNNIMFLITCLSAKMLTNNCPSYHEMNQCHNVLVISSSATTFMNDIARIVIEPSFRNNVFIVFQIDKLLVKNSDKVC